MSQTVAFPEVEPYESGHLPVDEQHSMYWEVSGNPAGIPVVFLHGGPGAAAGPNDRRFFDPAAYRIVLLHQRGAGKSTPTACVENNTTDHLVADIESLRAHLGIEKWHVFGGSWGSTLALYYAVCYRARCLSLTLRGIFLMRPEEIRWWLYDMGKIFPEQWRAFVDYIPKEEHDDLLEAYYRRLFGDNEATAREAALAWSTYEALCCTLLPNPDFIKSLTEGDGALCLARLEAHYFRNCLFDPTDLLLQKVATIRHIPTVIVQGRYDIVCPIETADELHRAWPEAEYVVIDDAGHSSREPGIAAALVAATERFKSISG